MNWNAIGAIGEILAAIAVFASLLYLAIQIRSNTNQSRAMMTHGLEKEYSGILDSVINNPQFAELLAKSLAIETLSSSEELQLRAYSNKFLNIYNATEAAFENRQISADYYEAMCQDADRVVREYPAIAKEARDLILQFPELSKKKVFKPFTTLTDD